MSRKKGQPVKDRAVQRLRRSARKVVAPVVKDVKALIHAHALFQSSLKMAADLRSHLEDRDVWARHASTRAIIVEYAKPWSGNKDQYLRHFKKIDSYLGDLATSDEHKELIELRDTVAAHTDGGAHPVAVVAIGTTVVNDRPMDQRYDNAYLTVRMRAESVYALGFADRAVIDRYAAHIEKVEHATRQELTAKMKQLHQLLVRFAPIVEDLADALGLLEVKDDGSTKQVPDVVSGPVFAEPVELATTDGALVTVVGRMESSYSIEPQLTSTGLNIKTEASGKNVNYEVSFTDINLEKLDEAASD